MHSSRMCTVRLLTVSCSIRVLVGVLPSEGVCLPMHSALWECRPPRGQTERCLPQLRLRTVEIHSVTLTIGDFFLVLKLDILLSPMGESCGASKK